MADEYSRTQVLNRIDQQWPCEHIVWCERDTGPEYCALPEWDPFTDRCWDHTSGNLPSGHM